MGMRIRRNETIENLATLAEAVVYSLDNGRWKKFLASASNDECWEMACEIMKKVLLRALESEDELTLDEVIETGKAFEKNGSTDLERWCGRALLWASTVRWFDQKVEPNVFSNRHTLRSP